MLNELKENNKSLYYTLICGGGTLLTIGTLSRLYVNRKTLCSYICECKPKVEKKCCKCCTCKEPKSCCDGCDCSSPEECSKAKAENKCDCTGCKCK